MGARSTAPGNLLLTIRSIVFLLHEAPYVAADVGGDEPAYVTAYEAGYSTGGVGRDGVDRMDELCRGG